MKIYLLSLLFILSSFSCKQEKKSIPKSKKTVQIPVIDPYQKAKEKAYQWINQLNFDLDYISNKKLGAKKFLAEYLGFYWKIYKNTEDASLKKEIKTHLKSYYQYTLQKRYHNMAIVDNKLFKKNSMSYLRVMWLLQQLDFDISYYQKETKRIMGRMNAHLASRGNWQKEVFKEYYHFFGYKMPPALKNNIVNNGVIKKQLAFNKYKKNDAYSFTHFVFAGFEYGNKTTQTRFDKKEQAYIKEILPKFTKHYREVIPNVDLLGEFVTCMVYMGYTDTDEFKKSYQYILNHQNLNGSWGKYEKHRKKIGNDIDFRGYLHTSLVVLESLLEYHEGNFAGSISK